MKTGQEAGIGSQKSEARGRRQEAGKISCILHLASCILFLFTLHCSLFSAAYATEPPNTKTDVVKKEKRLESLKREIIGKKKSLAYNVKKEHTILEDMERLDKALSKKEEELANIENSIIKLRQKTNALDVRIAGLTQEKERLAGLLEQRLVAMYKMKKGGVMQPLFSSDSVNDFGRRYKYINKIVEFDAGLLKDYRENQSLLEAEKERLKEFQTETFSLKTAVESKKEEIEEEKNKKETILIAIKKKKDIQLAAIREMESASQELQSFLDKFKKDMVENAVGASASGFAAMRGRLPLPVNGEIISRYGKIEHPKFHTVTFNNGIEIAASMGAEIKAVYKGRVAYSGWFRGYGKVMIVDHGEGYYTLFARLSKVIKDVNSPVEKGDVIALVGDTGSIKGPHLYFEVRKKGVPLDPLSWLIYDGIKVGSKR